MIDSYSSSYPLSQFHSNLEFRTLAKTFLPPDGSTAQTKRKGGRGWTRLREPHPAQHHLTFLISIT